MTAIFISHSSADNAAADEMRAWLTSKGHTSLFLDFDPDAGIPAGGDWEQTLYYKLRQCQAVIALLTPNWLASKWCFAELALARAGGKTIFPVKSQDCQAGQVFGDVQQIDLTTRLEEGYRRLEMGLKDCGLDPLDVFDWNPNRPPYPGLLAFQEEDAAIFFGRSEEILKVRETLETLRRQGRDAARFVLLLGASGSGKSSLARAGVIPRLKKQPTAWLPTPPFRPQDDPLEELAVALSAAFKQHGALRPWDILRTELHKGAVQDPADGHVLLKLARDLTLAANQPDATVLLTIDQTEELFGYSPSDAATRFLRLLRAALEAGGQRLFTLATLRSDFLAEFQNHLVLQDRSGEYAHHFHYQTVPVDPMPLRYFPQIITGPARLAGLRLEAGLVEAMTGDAGARDALPLLAFTLRRLYERYGQHGRLTISEYEALGGLEGAVREEAQRVLSAAKPSATELEALHAAFVPAMVRINAEGSYARRRALLLDMPPCAVSLLRRFVDARLLVTDRDADGREIIEVAHEALLRAWPQLTAWLAEDQDKLRLLQSLQRAAEDWDKEDRRSDLLLHRDDRLQDTEALLANPRFAAADGSVERAYLDECIRVQDERDVKERKYITDLKEALKNAERAAQIANARQLITDSGASLANGFPQRAGLLAVEVIKATDEDGLVAQAEQAVRDALGSISGFALVGHEGGISAMALDREGRWLVTGSMDTTARLWDLQAEDPNPTVRVLRGHEGGIRTVALDREGRWLVTGSMDATVRLWDLQAEDPNQTVRVLRGHGGAMINTVALDPRGRWLVIGGYEDKTARLWDLQAEDPNQTVRVLRGHESVIEAVALDPQGRWLVTGSWDTTARLWDLQAEDLNQTVRVLRGHESFITAVAMDREGRWLVTGSMDTTARLWDLQADDPNQTVRALCGHADAVNTLALDPQGRWLVTGSEDKTARLWDLQADDPNQTVRVLRGHEGWIITVALDPQGRWLVTGSMDKTARLWDLQAADPNLAFQVLRGHEGGIEAVALDPQGRWLVTGSEDKTARRWNLQTPDPHPTVRMLRGHEGGIDAVALDREGRWLVTGSLDKTARLWDLRTADPTQAVQVLRGGINTVALDPRGRWLVTGSEDMTARLWDLQVADPKQTVWVLRGHEGRIRTVALDPQGRWLVTSSRDTTARLWDLQAEDPNQTVRVLRGHEDGIRTVAIDSQGRWLVTGSQDTTARLWDLQAEDPNQTVQVLRGHEHAIAKVALDPQGRWLVTGSHDKTARLWDLQAKDPTQTARVLRGHEGGIWTVALDPQGRWLVTGGGDDTVRWWDLQAADPNRTVRVLRGHEGWIMAVALDPQGRWLATGGTDTTARLWDLQAADPNRTVRVLRGHEDWIIAVALDPQGRWLVTGSNDKTVRLWELRLNVLLDEACRAIGRNLTSAEWEQYFPGKPYCPTFPKLPVP